MKDLTAQEADVLVKRLIGPKAYVCGPFPEGGFNFRFEAYSGTGFFGGGRTRRAAIRRALEVRRESDDA